MVYFHVFFYLKNETFCILNLLLFFQLFVGIYNQSEPSGESRVFRAAPLPIFGNELLELALSTLPSSQTQQILRTVL